MSDISFWEAMKAVERLRPQWEYRKPYSYGELYFETTTPEGKVSVLIEHGYSTVGSSSPISDKDGFRLTITSNDRVIFLGHYRIEYKSGWFGGPEKPRYSSEYIYLKRYFEPYAAREQAKREEEKRKELEKKRMEELELQRERDRFFKR